MDMEKTTNEVEDVCVCAALQRIYETRLAVSNIMMMWWERSAEQNITQQAKTSGKSREKEKKTTNKLNFACGCHFFKKNNGEKANKMQMMPKFSSKIDNNDVDFFLNSLKNTKSPKTNTFSNQQWQQQQLNNYELWWPDDDDKVVHLIASLFQITAIFYRLYTRSKIESNRIQSSHEVLRWSVIWLNWADLVSWVWWKRRHKCRQQQQEVQSKRVCQ